MVILQVSGPTDGDAGFCFDCSAADECDSVVRAVAAVSNARAHLAQLAAAGLALCASVKASNSSDCTGGGDSVAVDGGLLVLAPGGASLIERTCGDAAALSAPAAGGGPRLLSLEPLMEAANAVRSAVVASFPDGLPAAHPFRQLLDEQGAFALEQCTTSAEAPSTSLGTAAAASTSNAVSYINPSTAALWWAGREFSRAVGSTVGARLGSSNEKTKVVVRLARRSGEPPARAPAVSEAERSAMMAWHFRRLEEARALADDADDAYLQAAWADPKQLKKELLGVGDIGYGRRPR